MDSPVWIPKGSRFSMLQTTIQLSYAYLRIAENHDKNLEVILDEKGTYVPNHFVFNLFPTLE